MAAEVPEREFVVFEGRRYTYHEFQARAQATAKALHACGVRHGSRVGLLMSNRPEWLEVSFGAHQLGATVAPMSTFYRAWDLEHVLRNSRVEILVTLPSFRGNSYLDFLSEIGLKSFPELRQVVVVGSNAPQGMITFDQALERGRAVEDEDIRACRASAHSRDLAYILYTSGSTARPKGVMVEHHGICENAWSMGERLHLTAEDRVWIVVPLAWGLGAENALPVTLTHRATVVLQEHFDAGEALRLMEQERVTAAYAMPNMTLALVEHPDHGGLDLSTLRTGITLGTPEELRRAIYEIPIPKICNAYGCTENYGNTCLTDAEMAAEQRMTCQGRPLPGMEVRVVDSVTGEAVAAGEVGELLVGGYVVPGYWEDPERTLETFVNGFYRTGDLGRFDSDGNLHYVSRIKDMIKSGGINVAPAEVEDFLATHPAVREAYVIGVPDPVKGEVLLALIQPVAGSQPNDAELIAWAKARIASYKIPQEWVFIAESDVPRTATGKVNKVELARRAAEGELK